MEDTLGNVEKLNEYDSNSKGQYPNLTFLSQKYNIGERQIPFQDVRYISHMLHSENRPTDLPFLIEYSNHFHEHEDDKPNPSTELNIGCIATRADQIVHQ